MKGQELETYLRGYQVSLLRGFVPVTPPPDQLPPAFHPWEALARRLPSLDRAAMRAAIEHLPPWPEEKLPSLATQERAMLLLCVLGHAYLHAEDNPPAALPARLAQPWQLLADRLGRLPVINHASLVLNNWRLIDATQPFALANLAPQFTFTGSPQESWFYLVTLMVELRGSQALQHAVAAALAAQAEQSEAVLAHLQALPSALQSTEAELNRMYEGCAPDFFYHQLRPWLDGVNGVYYEGCLPAVPRYYAGGSAAQSALLQTLDAALGIAHQTPFLRDMRAYMPPRHRALIEAVPSVAQSSVLGEPPLRQAHRAATEALQRLRQAHLNLVAHYIIQPAQQSGASTQGTGGTDAPRFLKQLRNETTFPS